MTRSLALATLIWFALTGTACPGGIEALSLGELLNLRVDAGNLLGMEKAAVPVSLTIITREEIERTPAANILDLMEVYVPGATYAMHLFGPRIGMRGVLGDQNHSFMLLVNGVEAGDKAYLTGPGFEIYNRDLNDIERIEVINGPGSVTYGPGAIGGVINIITRDAETAPGITAGAQSDARYRYNGVNTSAAYEGERFAFYLYAGANRATGEEDTRHYTIYRDHGAGFGFMSDDLGRFGSDPMKMHGDYMDKPELKFHMALSFLDDWRLWARYSSYNFTHVNQETTSLEGPAYGGRFNEMLSVNLSGEHSLSPGLSLKSSAGFTSRSYEQVRPGPNRSINDISGHFPVYSENEVTARGVVNYDHGERMRFALGGEFKYFYLGPAWGDDEDEFKLLFQRPLRWVVMDGDTAHSFDTVIGNTLDAATWSLFGEAHLELSPRFSLLLSGRMDKHEFAEAAYSPRIALISRIDERNIVHLIRQRSVRLPVFTDMYVEHELHGNSAEPEVLDGYELIYNRLHNENLSLSGSLFHNEIDQIAWSNERGGTSVAGTFELFGLELSARYKRADTRFGASYAYIHQLDWEERRNNEAFINVPGDPREILGPLSGNAENRINNFPGHTLKFFYSRDLSRSLTLHLDARVYWDYNQNDMLDMFKEAHELYGTEETREVMRSIYDDIRDRGYGKPSYTSNISLGWKLPLPNMDATAWLYARNLFSHNHMRYVFQFWETGNLRQYPRQVSFIEEPVTVGLKLNFEF